MIWCHQPSVGREQIWVLACFIPPPALASGTQAGTLTMLSQQRPVPAFRGALQQSIRKRTDAGYTRSCQSNWPQQPLLRLSPIPLRTNLNDGRGVRTFLVNVRDSCVLRATAGALPGAD
jgi:hypothetical protein